MDLFNFDLTPDYVDKYAGVSSHEKFRKMTTKSNVGMVIDKFSPFTKAKRAANPVKTIIARDFSNIDNTDVSQGVLIAGNSNAKNKTIVVNTETLTEQMENVHDDHEYQYFDEQMKYAYGSFSNLSRNAAFAQDYVKVMEDGLISGDYMQLIEMVHNMAKARVMGYMPDYSATMKDMPEPGVVGSASLAALAEDLLRGESLTGGAQLIDGKNKSSADWSDIETKIKSVITYDVGQGNSKAEDIIDSSYLPKFNFTPKGQPSPEDDKDGKEACQVGNGQVTYDESPQFSEQPTQKDKKWEMHNDMLENDQKSEIDDRFFFTVRDYEKENRNFEKHDHLIDALYESLSGRLGRKNSQTPAKRLNKRNVASDLSENIYVSPDPIGGKKLNINIVIDTSGSMSGNYIDDAVYILYVFNELARRGVVSGKVMLSSRGASGMWDFPMNKEMLQSIAAHNGGEGFRHTMAIRWKELKEADFNIAITDGHLTDGHIDLAEFEAANIFVTGMHIMRGMDKKNILHHTNGLKKWFSHSIVRSSVEEGIYSIVDQAILQLGSGEK